MQRSRAPLPSPATRVRRNKLRRWDQTIHVTSRTCGSIEHGREKLCQARIHHGGHEADRLPLPPPLARPSAHLILIFDDQNAHRDRQPPLRRAPLLQLPPLQCTALKALHRCKNPTERRSSGPSAPAYQCSSTRIHRQRAAAPQQSTIATPDRRTTRDSVAAQKHLPEVVVAQLPRQRLSPAAPVPTRALLWPWRVPRALALSQIHMSDAPMAVVAASVADTATPAPPAGPAVAPATPSTPCLAIAPVLAVSPAPPTAPAPPPPALVSSRRREAPAPAPASPTCERDQG